MYIFNGHHTHILLSFFFGILFSKYISRVLQIIIKKLLPTYKSRKHPNTSKKYEELDSEDEIDFETVKEPCKMVLVVRTDLKMGKGKISAQCCHACLGAFRRTNIDILKQWFGLGQTKVVLKCSNKQDLFDIGKVANNAGIPFYIVVDAGRTQIEPGTPTVCAVGPASISEVQKITGHLKLL